jgi:N-acetylneuraminic acid mutarotase
MGGQTFSHFYNDVWKTCDGAETWEEVLKDGEAPWKARAGLAGTMHNGKLYIAGGCHDNVPYDPGFFRTFFSDVWSSADGRTWELVTESPGWIGRSGPRLLSFKDELFVVAGEIGFTDSTQLADVWSSSDDGKTWAVATSNPAYSARSGHGVVVYGNDMILIAGWPELSDIYYTEDGADWVKSPGLAWNCDSTDCGKYDFWPLVHEDKLFLLGGSGSSSTFGKLYSETWSLDLLRANATTMLV